MESQEIAVTHDVVFKRKDILKEILKEIKSNSNKTWSSISAEIYGESNKNYSEELLRQYSAGTKSISVVNFKLLLSILNISKFNNEKITRYLKELHKIEALEKILDKNEIAIMKKEFARLEKEKKESIKFALKELQFAIKKLAGWDFNSGEILYIVDSTLHDINHVEPSSNEFFIIEPGQVPNFRKEHLKIAPVVLNLKILSMADKNNFDNFENLLL